MAEGIDQITSRLRLASARLPYLERALGLVWDVARGWMVLWIVLLIIQGLLPVAAVMLTKWLVNGLVLAIESGGAWETLRLPLFIALLMGLVLLAQQVLGNITTLVRTTISELAKDHISELVHRQSITLDLAFYDSPEYYDHLHRARYEAGYRPVQLLENMGSFCQNSITLAAMALVLITYAWWLPLALFLSVLPALLVVLQHTSREYAWSMRTTAVRRRTWYLDYVLTAREAAAEVRLFETGEHFLASFQALRAQLREERAALLKSQSQGSLFAGLSGLSVLGLTMVWMVWQALQGLVTLGDLALFYAAFNQGQGLLRSLLDNVGQIYGNMLFLSNLFEFLDLQPEVVDSAHPLPLPLSLQDRITFEDVTFRYPDSERLALLEFNLDIRAGEIAAIVGANGAGKTTLLKLLCRFYDPQAGHIAIDGADLRDLPLKELRQSITVLFQEPVPYQDSVETNISLGALASEPDREDIIAAAQAAGADSIVAKLPEGYETILGKWFEGGTDLSVGEWQRIALARAFLRQAAIIVLDEPTSAMDPWTETDWLLRFRQLVEDRTAVIITHRFTTAMHADTIHVMDEGRIVESGSHDELLSQNGRYAQSWYAQMNGQTAATS